MAGLEVVGAVSAASGLLEAAISVIKRVRKAYERQRELSSVLDSYNDELVTIKGVLQIVRDEESLRTAAVASQLDGIESLARKLNMCLQALDPGAKGFVRQFTHQLAHGSKEEKALADIMDALGHAKSDLSLHVQVANVGLIRTVGDKLVANAEVIDRVDLVLQQVFGEGRGLKIAALLKNKHPQDDGMVPLSDSDIACLGNGKPASLHAAAAAPKLAANISTSRIVINNITEGQALQINGPVGESGWKEVVQLEIRDNRAANKSIQVNHAISEDVFDRLLAARVAGLRE